MSDVLFTDMIYFMLLAPSWGKPSPCLSWLSCVCDWLSWFEGHGSEWRWIWTSCQTSQPADRWLDTEATIPTHGVVTFYSYSFLFFSPYLFSQHPFSLSLQSNAFFCLVSVQFILYVILSQLVMSHQNTRSRQIEIIAYDGNWSLKMSVSLPTDRPQPGCQRNGQSEPRWNARRGAEGILSIW